MRGQHVTSTLSSTPWQSTTCHSTSLESSRSQTPGSVFLFTTALFPCYITCLTVLRDFCQWVRLLAYFYSCQTTDVRVSWKWAAEMKNKREATISQLCMLSERACKPQCWQMILLHDCLASVLIKDFVALLFGLSVDQWFYCIIAWPQCWSIILWHDCLASVLINDLIALLFGLSVDKWFHCIIVWPQCW